VILSFAASATLRRFHSQIVAHGAFTNSPLVIRFRETAPPVPVISNPTVYSFFGMMYFFCQWSQFQNAKYVRVSFGIGKSNTAVSEIDAIGRVLEQSLESIMSYVSNKVKA
jgi:carbamoylphosphate synthase large subunit